MKDSINEKKARIGVFLCQCGDKIAPKVDLPSLERQVKNDPLVSHVETHPYPCMAPGLKAVRKAVEENKLDRIIVAGCESRIMLKKFERELLDSGLEQGQIAVANIRDHVAQVFDGEPEELATKAAKLIGSWAAGLDALTPMPRHRVEMNGPVMIVGGGIAGYSAAHELLRHQIEVRIAVDSDDIEDEIRTLHEFYPGERHYHRHLRKIMTEVEESPYVERIIGCDLKKVMGPVGNYSVAFSTQTGESQEYNAGTIIAALDTYMVNQGDNYGHDGERILCHTEMEERIWLHGPIHEKLVFWVNDIENDQPWAHLSARSAWNMAKYIRENSGLAQLTILYNDKIQLPMSATERAKSRQMGIRWIPYDGSVRPTVLAGYISFSRRDVQIEEELSWDRLVLSPVRGIGVEAIKVAEILGYDIVEGRFLERNPQMVRPEQVGQEEKLLAGSARRPCDLQESLRQGRRAASKVAEMVEKARAGQLYAPKIIVTVDETKCTGCGLCKEICDCGGIEPVEGAGGGIPRRVDPMVCTGGGTCAAACPYNALTLQTNTFGQMEARTAALVRRLDPNEVMGFACNWGGAAAADLAGLKGLRPDPNFYLLPISCIGQLDPRVMGRAFLEGANGMLLIGCPPEQCHHSYGLDHTWSRVNVIKKLLSLCGLERERITLAHADLNDPKHYVRIVDIFMETMARLGPIKRDSTTKERLQGLYETLQNPRMRWVLGAGLRRPREETYPGDQRNALAYDETLSDVLTEEFLRARVLNILKGAGEIVKANIVANALGEDKTQVSQCLAAMVKEGLISRIYKDRTPYYNVG